MPSQMECNRRDGNEKPTNLSLIAFPNLSSLKHGEKFTFRYLVYKKHILYAHSLRTKPNLTKPFIQKATKPNYGTLNKHVGIKENILGTKNVNKLLSRPKIKFLTL